MLLCPPCVHRPAISGFTLQQIVGTWTMQITLRSPSSGHDIRTQGHGPCAFLALVGAFYTAHSDTDKDQYKFFYQKTVE